jgi:hypothetical protein
MSEARKNLQSCQRQLDADRLFVGVSRQALEEVMGQYDKMLAALRVAVVVAQSTADGMSSLGIDIPSLRLARDEIAAAIAVASAAPQPAPAAPGDWPPVVTDAMVNRFLDVRNISGTGNPHTYGVEGYPDTVRAIHDLLDRLPRPEPVTVWGVPSGWRLVNPDIWTAKMSRVYFETCGPHETYQAVINAAPPPPPVVIDDAMVERARQVLMTRGGSSVAIRAALAAALGVQE